MLSFERNSHQGTWTQSRNIHVGGLSKNRAKGGTALLPSNNAMAPGRANNSIRSISCELCGTTRNDIGDLLRHIRAAHINSNYSCTCRKSYTRNDNYIRHLRECKVKHDLSMTKVLSSASAARNTAFLTSTWHISKTAEYGNQAVRRCEE